MADPISQALDFILTNWWLPLIIIGGFVIWKYLQPSFRGKLQAVDRGNVERKRFIDRLMFNPSNKLFIRENHETIGKIVSMRAIDLKEGNPENLQIIEAVVKPFFPFPFLKIVNFFAKGNAFEITKKNVYFRGNEVILKSDTNFDRYMGIYYDISKEAELQAHIKDDSLLRTDLENLASIYYAKSQEQSTFSPEYSHEVMIEQIKLKQEQAKREAKVTG